MKTISPRDASVLAFIAENPDLPQQRLEALLELVEGKENRKIITLLVSKKDSGGHYTPRQRKAANALKAWASRQRSFAPASG